MLTQLQSMKRLSLSAKERRKPGLLIIGAQKAGTSALWGMLARHPDLLPSSPKELHFFNRDENYNKGLDHYLSHFQYTPGRRSLTMNFEATPAYIFSAEKTAPRIKEHLPKVVCCAILRDPVKRAYSAWNMFRDFKGDPRHGHLHDPRSFAQAVKDEMEGRTEHRYHMYLARGHYAGQIAAFQAQFPKDQLWIRSYLDLKRDPRAFVNDLCRQLHLPPMPAEVDLNSIKANKRPYTAPLDPGLAAELYRYFSPEMEKLDRVLGYHLDILEDHG